MSTVSLEYESDEETFSMRTLRPACHSWSHRYHSNYIAANEGLFYMNNYLIHRSNKINNCRFLANVVTQLLISGHAKMH